MQKQVEVVRQRSKARTEMKVEETEPKEMVVEEGMEMKKRRESRGLLRL